MGLLTSAVDMLRQASAKLAIALEPYEPCLVDLAEFEKELREDLQCGYPPIIPINGCDITVRRGWTPREIVAMNENYDAQVKISHRVWEEVLGYPLPD